MSIADKDLLDSKLDIAIIASLPSAYIRSNVCKVQDQTVAQATTDKMVGKIKDRVDLKVTVLKSFLSHKWSCYFITAVTENEEVVFFGSSKINPKIPIPEIIE